jgi:hypothetical protein
MNIEDVLIHEIAAFWRAEAREPSVILAEPYTASEIQPAPEPGELAFYEGIPIYRSEDVPRGEFVIF